MSVFPTAQKEVCWCSQQTSYCFIEKSSSLLYLAEAKSSRHNFDNAIVAREFFLLASKTSSSLTRALECRESAAFKSALAQLCVAARPKQTAA
jgi:hypothetical protein